MSHNTEPDRCIRVEIPAKGFFTITRDVAERWIISMGAQLMALDAEIEDNDQLPMDTPNP